MQKTALITASIISLILSACAETTTIDTPASQEAECGNGFLEAGESCDGNCPVSCNDNNACTTDILAGAASTCNAVCSFQTIDSCLNDDGCCASGCNETNDTDCIAECGNEVVEYGETCDGDCPVACDDYDFCTADSLSGSDSICNVVCEFDAIESCQDDDGCCPSGCNEGNDTDCSSVCGNGITESGEYCDGDCPVSCGDADSCTADVLNGSADECTAICSFETIVVCEDDDGCCPSDCSQADDLDCDAVCGNEIVEDGEVCDGDCPVACIDWDYCTTDVFEGDDSTCDAVCTFEPVTSCVSDDGCCPGDCTSAEDNDCFCTPGLWASTVVHVAESNTYTDLNVGGQSSLAIDSAGGLHISYWDQNGNNQEYAYKAVDGDWATTTVYSSGHTGHGSSIGVDSLGGVHISFYSSEYPSSVYYAHLPPEGVWNVQLLDDSTAGIGQDTSLVVDAQDNVHVAYYDSWENTLRYGFKPKDGSFTLESFGENTIGSTEISLAVDVAGGLHIAYYAALAGVDGLAYAYRAYGFDEEWAFETIDSNADTGYAQCSIALDSLGGAHVVYRANSNLKHATRTAGATADWAIDGIEWGVGYRSSLAVDADDGIHVTYCNSSGGLYYGYRGAADTSWSSDTISGGLNYTSKESSLALDSSGNAHISYDSDYVTNVNGSSEIGTKLYYSFGVCE